MGLNIKGFVKDVLKMSFSMAGIGTGIGKGTDSSRLEPSDVEILAVDLVTGPGGTTVQSLAAVIKEINIYESILSPAVFCELIVYDGNDLVDAAKVTSYRNSYIKVAFKSPNVKKPSEYVFIIEDVIAGEQKNANLSQVYVLRCIPPELVSSNKMLLGPWAAEARWDGAVKGLPSDAIQLILEYALKTEKKVHIKKKPDISIDEIFAPGHPFVLIDELRKYCVTHDYISSCFVFYEDCDGYHLNTIENMIQEQKTIFGSNDSDKIFYFDAKRNNNVEGSNYRSILGFKTISVASVLNDNKRIDFAYFTPEHATPDTQGLVQQLYKDWTSGREANRNNFIMDQEGEPLFSIESEKSAKDARAAQLIVVVDGDKPDLLSGQVMVQRMAFLANLLTNMKHIYVYGDNSIRVGNLITANFVRPIDITDTDSPTTRSSGQYMVGKIRHMIINDDRPKYFMSMEIFKSGVQKG